MAFVTSEFGKRKKPCPTCSENHPGIDLRAGVGSPIYANQDLKVSRIRDFGQSGYGKSLYVKDPNDPSKEYIFGHLDDNNPGKFKTGETIPQGTVIAYSGNTGSSTGEHLHFETRVNGVPVPPKDYAGIASFDKNIGNLLNTTAKSDKTRPDKPSVAPTTPGVNTDNRTKTPQEIALERQRERTRTGPGSNIRPRPTGNDVGVLINPRHILGDGA